MGAKMWHPFTSPQAAEQELHHIAVLDLVVAADRPHVAEVPDLLQAANLDQFVGRRELGADEPRFHVAVDLSGGDLGGGAARISHAWSLFFTTV